MAKKNPSVSPDQVRAGLGAFDDLEYLDEGSFGTTFRAVRAGKEYALKVLYKPPGFYLMREVESLKRVNHPNVVRLHRADKFDLNGTTYHFLECEFINGGTIADKLNAKALIPTSGDLRALLVALLRGAGAIHAAGIIHRDIKPNNVALRGGSWAKPVILDFGVAKVLDMSSHTQGPQPGTLPFMAPEQIRGRRAQARNDLFSIAVVVYLSATGQHPFCRPNDTCDRATLLKRMQQPAPSPRSLSKIWEKDTEAVVLRLLSPNGHERLGVERALSDLGAN